MQNRGEVVGEADRQAVAGHRQARTAAVGGARHRVGGVRGADQEALDQRHLHEGGAHVGLPHRLGGVRREAADGEHEERQGVQVAPARAARRARFACLLFILSVVRCRKV